MVESSDAPVEPNEPLESSGPTRPIEEDIDEVYERIYMSNQPAAACLETIQKNGITHIIRVTPSPTPQHSGIAYLVFDKIFDDSAQELLPFFTESNLFIKQALEENAANRVLIHCSRGISRSAAFAAAYMIAEAKFSLEEALTYGQLNREHFSPNRNFLAQLQTLEQVFIKP